jgi:hypothetical protein
MKTFPVEFASEKNKKTGIAPVWILKLTAGGEDYYLSGDVVYLQEWNGDVNTLPWVSSWGEVREGVSGTLGEIRMSDFNVELLIDPDASPNAEDIATQYELEASPASLYLWFADLDPSTDPPQEILRGYVRDIALPDDATVRLTIEDESSRLEKYIGTKVDRTTYPNADQDDIGKVLPIVYGSVSKLPARAVDAGVKTSLPAAISESATEFDVSDATGLAVDMVLQIDDERMTITSIIDDTLQVTRGSESTAAASHLKGAVVWQVKSVFAYVVASHPVDSMPKIYARLGDAEVDISSAATCYTGKTGDEHPSYPGMAVATIPGYITVQQAVQMWVNDGIAIEDTVSILNDLAIFSDLGVNDTITIDNLLSVASTLGISDTLTINDGIGIDDLITILDGIGIDDLIALSDTLALSEDIIVADEGHEHEAETSTVNVQPDSIEGASGLFWVVPKGNAIDDDTNTAAILNNRSSYGDATVTRVANYSGSGTPVSYRWAIMYGDSTYSKGLKVDGVYTLPDSTSKTVWYSSWKTLSSWNTIDGKSIDFGAIGGQARVWEVWLEVKYYASGVGVGFAQANISKTGTVDLTGTVSKSGTVSKTGTVSKSGAVSKTGTVDRSGSVALSGDVGLSGSVDKSGTVALTGDVSLGGSVTKTGTVVKTGTATLAGNSVANTLVGDTVMVDVVRNVSTPGAVVEDILSTYCGVASFAQRGSLPATYRIDGAITEYRRAIDWLNDIALQSRCYFRMHLGTGLLIARPDYLSSVKTIPACRISDGRKAYSRTKVSYSDVLNVINLLYDRDWTQPKGDGAYKASTSDSDATSIAAYGEQERPDLFMMDFVRDADMANSLRDFYLTQYATRRWQHAPEVFLDHCELEFADAVTLGFSGNVVGEIQEVRFSPGSTERMDVIGLVLLA